MIYPLVENQFTSLSGLSTTESQKVNTCCCLSSPVVSAVPNQIQEANAMSCLVGHNFTPDVIDRQAVILLCVFDAETDIDRLPEGIGVKAVDTCEGRSGCIIIV